MNASDRAEPGWYFHGPAGPAKEDTWRWWQDRRFRYNRDLFFVGAATWLLVLFAGSAAVKPGVDFEEPLMMLMGPPFYALFANLAYSAGPIADTIHFAGAPRRHWLKRGYFFSIILTALPGAWALAAWLWTVMTGNQFE